MISVNSEIICLAKRIKSDIEARFHPSLTFSRCCARWSVRSSPISTRSHRSVERHHWRNRDLGLHRARHERFETLLDLLSSRHSRVWIEHYHRQDRVWCSSNVPRCSCRYAANARRNSKERHPHCAWLWLDRVRRERKCRNRAEWERGRRQVWWLDRVVSVVSHRTSDRCQPRQRDIDQWRDVWIESVHSIVRRHRDRDPVEPLRSPTEHWRMLPMLPMLDLWREGRRHFSFDSYHRWEISLAQHGITARYHPEEQTTSTIEEKIGSDRYVHSSALRWSLRDTTWKERSSSWSADASWPGQKKSKAKMTQRVEKKSSSCKYRLVKEIVSKTNESTKVFSTHTHTRSDRSMAGSS